MCDLTLPYVPTLRVLAARSRGTAYAIHSAKSNGGNNLGRGDPAAMRIDGLNAPQFEGSAAMIAALTGVADDLLGLLTPRANERGAVLGTLAGTAAVALAVVLGLPARMGVHPLWLAPPALLLTMGLGWAASLGGPPPPGRLAGLTWWTRAQGSPSGSGGEDR